MNDEELRAGIRQAASVAGSPPPDLARTVLRRRRRQRRQTAGVLGAALAVVLVAVGAPVAYNTLNQSTPATVAAAGSTVQGVATRGDLAGDDVLLRELQQLSWNPAQTPAAAYYSLDVSNPPVSSAYYVATDLAAAIPPAERRVVWAGDVPGGRWALLAIPTPGGWAAAWFTGPEEATASQMLISGPVQLVTDTEPLAHIDLANPAKALVVIGAPDDYLTISDQIDVQDDGSVVQEYRELPAVDGVAVTTVTTDLRYGVATTVQAGNAERTWQAQPTASGPVAGVLAGGPGGWSIDDPELPNIIARGTTSAATSRVLSDAMLASILGPTGLTLRQIAETGPHLTELSSSFRFDETTFGSGPSTDDQDQGFTPQPTVTVWDLELPSGAHAVMAGWSADTDDNTVAGEDTASSYRYEQTLLTIRESDFDPTVDLVATAMDIPALGDRPAVSVAVVAGSPDGATARFLDDEGTALGEARLTNGTAVTANPPEGLASVEVLDRDGEVVQSAGLSSGIADLEPEAAQSTYLTEPITLATVSSTTATTPPTSTDTPGSNTTLPPSGTSPELPPATPEPPTPTAGTTPTNPGSSTTATTDQTPPTTGEPNG